MQQSILHFSAGTIWASTEIGAYIGTFVPVPIVGTVVGGLVGAGVGYAIDYFTSDSKEMIKQSLR